MLLKVNPMFNPKRKGKPFESMGRKAVDLKTAKTVYGGTVAEVKVALKYPLLL